MFNKIAALVLAALLLTGCGHKAGDIIRHEIVLPPWSEVDLPEIRGRVTIDEFRFTPAENVANSPLLHRHFLRDVAITFVHDDRTAYKYDVAIGEFTGNPLYRFQSGTTAIGSDDRSVWTTERKAAKKRLRISLQNLSEEEIAFTIELRMGEFVPELISKGGGLEPGPDVPDDGIRFYGDENPDHLMADLARFESKGDYRGAQWFLDDILHHYEPAPMLESIFELRSMAYETRRMGFASMEPMLEAFLSEPEDFEALSQATSILALYQESGTSLLTCWSATEPEAIYLDGRRVDTASNGFGLYYVNQVLVPGKHVVGLLYPPAIAPPEFQFLWQTGEASYVFDDSVRFSVDPKEGWEAVDLDVDVKDDDWRVPKVLRLPFQTETPPHAFIDLHSAPMVRGVPAAKFRQAFRLAIELPE